MGCKFGNAPSLANDAGTKCLSLGPSSWAGVAPVSYWSSATYMIDGRYAFSMDLNVGGLNASDKDFFSYRVWPVRVAPR